MKDTNKAFSNRIDIPLGPTPNHLPNGKFKPGNLANPAGRPKGKTMKEYSREWFFNLTDEQKTAYILALEEKRPGFAWTMAEGNPQEDKNITVKVPTPILGGATKAITQGAVASAALGSGTDDTSGVVLPPSSEAILETQSAIQNPPPVSQAG